MSEANSAIRDADVQDGDVDTTDTTTTTTATTTTSERQKTARELAMDEIAERNRQALADEMKEPDASSVAAPAAAPPAAPASDELARQLEGDGPVALNGDLSRFRIRVKVDGEEMDVPLDQVTRNYQKGGAADKRLAEATRLQTEATRLHNEATTRAAATPAAAAPAPSPTPGATATTPAAGLDVARQYSSALFEGDEDKAARLFDEAVQQGVRTAMEKAAPGRSDATPTPELIAAVSHSVKQQQVVDSALAKSRADYPALYADPDVEQLAAAKITRRVEEGIPFTEALETVGSEFAKTFGWRGPGRTQPRPEADRERNKRLDRKAGIDNVPATNARSATTTPAEADVTDENQRAARGIAQIIAKRPGQLPAG